MSDIVDRMRDTADAFELAQAPAHLPLMMRASADEIERLRARVAELEEALRKIEYLDRPQVRGLPRRVSIHDIARATLAKTGESDE